MNIRLCVLVLLGIIIFESGIAQNCNQGDQDPSQPGNPELQDPVGGDSIPVAIPLDPNEIVGTRGYDTAQWVSINENLPYTVYFENDPDFATAAAQRVEIRHKFHGNANMFSFGVGSFGFGNLVVEVPGSPVYYQKRLDLTASIGIFVDVVAGLDVTRGEAFWIFETIDPATGLPPQSVNVGFLPINDSIGSGEGFVNFTLKPKTECQQGQANPCGST